MNRMIARMRFLAFAGTLLLLALGVGGSAAARPQLAPTDPIHLAAPFGPWGKVTLNGSDAPGGTEVSAWIGSTRLGSTTTVIGTAPGETTSHSWYAVEVSGDDPSTTTKEGGVPGDKVTFRVGERPTCQTIAWEGGTSPQFDLVARNQEFADVPYSLWAFCNISQIFQQGITTGCVGSDDPAVRRYCPDGTVTRAQMAAFLVRAKGLTACNDCTQSFSDVPPTHWAYGWIETLYRQGITTGCVAGSSPAERRFCPEDSVSRDQMAAFLMRAKGLTACNDCTQSFGDVPPTHWAYGWIEALYRQGITTGCVAAPTMADRKYCPAGLVTRAEMAAFLSRAFPPAAGPTSQ